MKKSLLFFSIMLMLFVASCADKTAYTIKGTLPNAEYDGKQIVLQQFDSVWRAFVTVDSTTIQNGTFEFKGKSLDGAVLRSINLSEENEKISNVLLVVEPGNIEVTLDSISKVKGTPLNDQYQTFCDKGNALITEMGDLYKKVKADPEDEESKKEIEPKLNALRDQMVASIFSFAKENAQNPFGEYVFISNSYYFTVDQLKEIFALVKPEFKSNERVQKLEKRMQALDATSEGKIFTDIKGKTPQDKDASLSDFAGKGKYVLVDFWASWCGPCVREMPSVVAIYAKYKTKDFEIVGVSLDKEKASWEAAIKNLNITWPQISDLKGWESELSGAYGVASIPHMMLLDKDGKILARGISSEELAAKLEELLK